MYRFFITILIFNSDSEFVRTICLLVDSRIFKNVPTYTQLRYIYYSLKFHIIRYLEKQNKTSFFGESRFLYTFLINK